MVTDGNGVIIRIIPAGSGRFSARATTLVFAGEDPKALPPHETRSKGLPWEVQIFLKAPLRGVDGGGALRALVPDTPRQAARCSWSVWSRLTLHGRGTSRAMAAAAHEHRAC